MDERMHLLRYLLVDSDSFRNREDTGYSGGKYNVGMKSGQDDYAWEYQYSVGQEVFFNPDVGYSPKQNVPSEQKAKYLTGKITEINAKRINVFYTDNTFAPVWADRIEADTDATKNPGENQVSGVYYVEHYAIKPLKMMNNINTALNVVGELEQIATPPPAQVSVPPSPALVILLRSYGINSTDWDEIQDLIFKNRFVQNIDPSLSDALRKNVANLAQSPSAAGQKSIR